jgi:hypothetical protein
MGPSDRLIVPRLAARAPPEARGAVPVVTGGQATAQLLAQLDFPASSPSHM